MSTYISHYFFYVWHLDDVIKHRSTHTKTEKKGGAYERFLTIGEKKTENVVLMYAIKRENEDSNSIETDTKNNERNY
jgi:hypothetical protein